MNQHICGPHWEDALNDGVASKAYPGAPNLVLLCCAAGQRLIDSSDDPRKWRCDNCPSGWYQNHSASKRPDCTSCVPGLGGPTCNYSAKVVGVRRYLINMARSRYGAVRKSHLACVRAFSAQSAD